MLDLSQEYADKERAEAVLPTRAPALTTNETEPHSMADEQLAQQFLTYKYRLLPTRRQHVALASVCEAQRLLYNAALEERINCYRKTVKGRTYVDQCKALTEWRRDDAEAAATPLNIQRWTIKRLDDAYKAFFRRLKASDGKAGFPRFRGYGRWNAFGFNEMDGLRFDGRRIRFKGLPSGLRVHMHRPLPDGAAIKSCVFRRDHKGWSVCFQVAVPSAEKRAVETSIGIDVGLSAFATFSDGSAIPAPQIARRAHRKMRLRQRALARCKRGSNRRNKGKAALARESAKVLNERTTWLHQQSARIAKQYDLIAVEDLKVRNMVKNPYLARSISDAGWCKFIEMLSYKAEKAGGQVIKVNPKNTSQACSGCGVIVKKDLSQRVHDCPDCGLVLDRDHNAALNILRAGIVARGTLNVAGCGERAAGKITSLGL